MMKFRTLAAAFSLLAVTASAKIVTQDLDYKDGKTVCQGYLAYDDAKTAPVPGILLAHQWTGLGEYEKGRAKQLAELGYTVLCADIYGKGARPDPRDMKACGAEAGKFKGDRALLRERMKAGLKALLAQKSVDPKNIAVLGYCFGGMAALELGRSGANIKGIVSFHGALDSPTPADGRNIKAKVLVMQGADDPFVSKKDIAACEDELKAAKVDYQFIFYSGAVHAFTEPMAGNDNSKGTAYNASADKRSWIAMKNFLDEIFASN